MPRLDSTVMDKGLKSQAKMRPPFGPGFTEIDINNSDRMEIWMSNFSDAGSDYVEFKLLKGEELINSRTLIGY